MLDNLFNFMTTFPHLTQALGTSELSASGVQDSTPFFKPAKYEPPGLQKELICHLELLTEDTLENANWPLSLNNDGRSSKLAIPEIKERNLRLYT